MNIATIEAGKAYKIKIGGKFRLFTVKDIEPIRYPHTSRMATITNPYGDDSPWIFFEDEQGIEPAATVYVAAYRNSFGGPFLWAADDEHGNPITEGKSATRADVPGDLARAFPESYIDVAYIDNGYGI